MILLLSRDNSDIAGSTRPQTCRLACIVALLGACLAAAPTSSTSKPAEPSDRWWNQLWPYRARIDCPPASGEVASVTVTLAGRSADNGADLRLVDETGRQQPFEIIHHDPLLQTTLAIRVPDGKPATFWLYFGHPHPSKINTVQPDARQPAWEPKAGLVLRTYRKARPQYPKTLADLLKMVADAKQEGGGFVSNISQGHNPWGLSDQYLSVYQGWLRIDAPGKYGFCSASADGSWIIINDKTIVQWPGPHGWGGSERGQINGSIDLPRGAARVMYYHEAGAGPQLAFMGWKPPGRNRFTPVPQQQWTSPRQAEVAVYESAKKPLMAVPQVELLNTYWLPDTIGKQAALVRVDSNRSVSRAGNIAQVNWDFGDGLSANGARQRHVYFRLGRPTIKLTLQDAAGNSDSVTCAPDIFLQDVQAADVRFGNADEYARDAADYDTAKLPREDLSLYVEFWLRLERWKAFTAAARVYAQRFPDAPDLALFAARAANACADPLAAYDPALAEQMYDIAIAKTSHDSQDRQDLVLRRVLNLSWNLHQLDRAKAVCRQIIDSSQADKSARSLLRGATIALGDVALLSGDFAGAKDHYTQAEAMHDPKSPADQAAELARLGSYPWAVDDYLGRGDFDQAQATLDEWENAFPLQKLEGTSMLLRGKVLFVRQPCEPALKYLELAEAVNPHGTQVPEAVWLRANCLMSLGRTAEAAAMFSRVMTEFTRSEFAGKASTKLAECERKLSNAGADKAH